MKFCDFTVHLGESAQSGLSIHTSDGAARKELTSMLDQVQNISQYDIGERVQAVSKLYKDKGCQAFNIMIMDQRVLDQDCAPDWLTQKEDHVSFTLLLHPQSDNAHALVEKAAQWGFGGIKFHPYMQELDDSTFDAAVSVAKKAEELGLWIAVDASYGTINVYEHNGVRLLIALAREIKETPIIALHSGGKLVLDVMSVAMSCPNILMEFSLSIPFWLESSIEQDFAFAIGKIGVERCMFSSDHPFIDLDTALDATKGFLDKYEFTDKEQEAYFLETCRGLLS